VRTGAIPAEATAEREGRHDEPGPDGREQPVRRRDVGGRPRAARGQAAGDREGDRRAGSGNERVPGTGRRVAVVEVLGERAGQRGVDALVDRLVRQARVGGLPAAQAGAGEHDPRERRKHSHALGGQSAHHRA
jgi:hypothetical protein